MKIINKDITEYYLNYNKDQTDVVMDGQMYNQPYGITSDSWKEIEQFEATNGWNKFQYTFEMDNTNFRFVFRDNKN